MKNIKFHLNSRHVFNLLSALAILGQLMCFVTPAAAQRTSLRTPSGKTSGIPLTGIPELMYYKFDGTGSNVVNYAMTPVGSQPATILGAVTQGGAGQFGGGLIGTGNASSSDYLNTGWAPNLGGQSWTISLYLNGNYASTTLFYFFGDVGTNSFRCFTNGVAGTGNLALRGAGLNDTFVNGAAPANVPTVTHFVYDSVALETRAYVNGVLVVTVPQTGANLTGTGPLKVMGYSSNVGSPAGGVIDEFRLYNRALDAAEIASTWNVSLLTPSAARVAVSGRAVTLAGAGLSNVTVTLTGPNGDVLTARTNTFGVFNFEGVTAGANYVLSARGKGVTFPSSVIDVTDEVREINIVAVE